MATKTFTKQYLAGLPTEGRYELRDAHTKGLLIRGENGRKTFVFQIARGRRVTIGPHPTITIGLAREECQRIIQRVGSRRR